MDDLINSMHSEKCSEKINLEKKTRPERMFSEHEQDGEAGREAAAAKEDCDAEENQAWQKRSLLPD